MPPGPEDALGPILIGLLFDAILLGTLAIQVLTYFHRYRRDRLWFKLLIGYLFVIEIINTALDFMTAYEPLIQKFGSPQALEKSPTFLLADPITTTLVSTPVQLFMAWRVRIISRSILIPIAIAVLSIVSFGSNIWLSHQIHTDTFQSHATQAVSSTWLVASSITDITISLAIVYFVVSQRRLMARDKQFSMYLSRMMWFAVQSGVLTSFSMILALIVFLTVHKGPYFLIWDLSFSKLYTNSLIASLNARAVHNHKEEQARPALFIDDSTIGKSTGAGQRSTRVWEDVSVSVGHPLTAIQMHKAPLTRFPERSTSFGQVSIMAPVTLRVIYPDESGRYRPPGAGGPLKQSDNQYNHPPPPNQYYGR